MISKLSIHKNIKGPKEPKRLLKIRKWKRRPWCYVLDVKVSHRLMVPSWWQSCGKLCNLLSWGRPTGAGSVRGRLEVHVPSLLPDLPRYRPALATTARSCSQPHAFHVMRTVPSDREWTKLLLPCVVSHQIFGHGNEKSKEVAAGSQHLLSLSNLGNSSWLGETDRGIQWNWQRCPLTWTSEIQSAPKSNTFWMLDPSPQIQKLAIWNSGM